MAGARRAAVWVIDGASQLGDHTLVEGRSPAAWLAATASAYLARTPWAESGRPIRDVVRELILYVREAGRHAGLADAAGFPSANPQPRAPGARPPRTLPARRQSCSRAAAFVDPQFDGAEERLLDAVRAELDRGVAPATVYARAQATNRERRIQRNTPAGLWVLADVPEAAEHAFVTTVPITSGMELVVMSDGFARALHPFGLVTDTDALLDEIAAGRAEALLDRLRTAERADSARVAFPRFSISDDATMLHARLSRTD
ncbi:hypothetical protein [Candidatus Frankia nodulisporulans]|uniref:hypothetical protein n=1 Tax=Candidatus Frankia nodulisporulans TaxID=2060052 RepID=UPI001CDB7F6F|nr:hypothetical protein [Candidatus Frankia nodulisporulans]